MSGFQGRSIFKNAYRSDIIRLVLICSGLFVFLWFIEINFLMTTDGTAFFFKYMKNPLLLPLDQSQFLKQPWSILTFGFLDENFWALFTNMIWLWIFGSVLEDLNGTNRVLPIFWFGFIFAGLVLLVTNVFAQSTVELYASTLGGVAAVAFAAVAYRPKAAVYSIFNKSVPVYIFAIFFLIISIYFNWQNLNVIILFLSGGLLGFLSQNVLKVFFENVRNLLATLRSYFSSNENFIKKKRKGGTVKFDEINSKLKAITNKLNADGFESLSTEEIEVLKFHNKL